MTGLQAAAVTLVLLGAMLLGSVAAVLGFLTGVGLGWLLWGGRP